MARSIPAQFAPVVEALELDGAVVVTAAELRRLFHDAGVATEASVAISRLAAHGWLLPTGVRGAWEFVPGSAAGPVSRGDPFLTLQAQRAVTPDLDVRIALASAMWLHGLVDRPPERHLVMAPTRDRVPVALKRAYTTTTFDAATPPTPVRGIPVSSAATLLVHMAASPTAVTNWGLVLDGLGDLVAAADRDALQAELAGRPNATLARLAYLLHPFDPEFVETSIDVADQGVVWFGPRQRVRRTDPRWHIADTVLPVRPTDLEPVVT